MKKKTTQTKTTPSQAERRNGARNAQLIRLLGLVRDLDRIGGIDLYELAERNGTTVRTIRRDFDALQAAGLPLKQERVGKRMHWSIAYKDKLQHLSGLLDAQHYLGLQVAMGQAGAGRTTSILTALEDLSDKVEAAVGEKGKQQLDEIGSCFQSYEKFAYANTPPDVLWPLVQAISARRHCHVTYRAARPLAESKSYEILPLKLFPHQGAVYLWCAVVPYTDITTLNLQRLEQLKVLETHGEVPADFDPAKLEASAFGVYTSGKLRSYRLRFSPEVAVYIREKVWHPTQKLVAQPDGGVELTFRCGESPEVSSWVAGWREEVQVLGPAALRKELTKLGAWLTSTYGG